MVRYTCPICEQTMTSKHYCIHCKSWVIRPDIRDVNYYLNERHPDVEANCSYHISEQQQKDEQKRKRVAMGGSAEHYISTAKALSKREFQNAAELIRENADRQSEKENKTDAKKPISAALVFFILIVLFNILGPFLRQIGALMRRLF